MDAKPPSDDVLCVLRAQTGDGAAFEALLARVEAALFRHVLTIVRERTRAEDVLQETFVRVWRNLGWLRDPELFKPWAFRIASREAFRVLGRERLWDERTEVQDLDTLSAYDARRSEPEPSAKLGALVGALPPASRAIVSLVYYEGFTLSEAAAVLDVPPGTVRSRLAYGLARLREQLGRPDDRRRMER